MRGDECPSCGADHDECVRISSGAFHQSTTWQHGRSWHEATYVIVAGYPARHTDGAILGKLAYVGMTDDMVTSIIIGHPSILTTDWL